MSTDIDKINDGNGDNSQENTLKQQEDHRQNAAQQQEAAAENHLLDVLQQGQEAVIPR